MQKVKLSQKNQLICVQELNAQECDTQNGMKARHEIRAWKQGTKAGHESKAQKKRRAEARRCELCMSSD